MNILDQIIEHKRSEVDLLKKRFWNTQPDKINYLAQIEKSTISFFDALQNSKHKWPKLIAEVKKGSPSQGLIRADFDVVGIMKLYDRYADAMSILTDTKFFLGSLENLIIARQHTNKPLLRKDFIIDEFQIYEARLAGANAVLLLASVLNLEEIQRFLDLTHSLGMDALVEVHYEIELENVLKTNAKIIGINNRNLKDFSIDLENSNRLANLIPEGKIIVSESGISNKHEIKKVSQNVHAILVGTAITKNIDLESKIREIVGLPQFKICGITNSEDAEIAVNHKADYLGFIFYKNSPRYISPEDCAEIIQKFKKLNPKLQTKFVGVFVNEPIEQIIEIIEICDLDVVQLHGDETQVDIQNLNLNLQNKEKKIEIWKALRIKDQSDLVKTTNSSNVDGFLLDAYKKDVFGGTGESFNWEILSDFNPKQKVVLAGGLDALNLPSLINSYHPDVVDLSSKIEVLPGKKDLDKLRAVLAIKNFLF